MLRGKGIHQTAEKAELTPTALHFQMSQPYLNSTLHIHIVSLYKLSLFHPELPLSPQSPPLSISLSI